MKTWTIAVVVVVVIAVGVGAFFGGHAMAGSSTPTLQQAMKVLQNATAQQREQAFSGSGSSSGTGGFGGAGRTGGGAVTGSIISATSNSITVKSSDGSTHIVLFGNSTTISKFTQASASDLTTGQNVLVTGTTNSDGTVTATRIEVGVTIPQRSTTGSTGAGSGAGAPGSSSAPSGGSTATSAAQ